MDFENFARVSRDLANAASSDLADLEARFAEDAHREYERREAEEAAALATIETAKEVEQINDKIHELYESLLLEAENRRRSDEENMRYTKKNDQRNLAVTIAGIALTAIAIGVTCFWSGRSSTPIVIIDPAPYGVTEQEYGEDNPERLQEP